MSARRHLVALSLAAYACSPSAEGACCPSEEAPAVFSEVGRLPGYGDVVLPRSSPVRLALGATVEFSLDRDFESLEAEPSGVLALAPDENPYPRSFVVDAVGAGTATVRTDDRCDRRGALAVEVAPVATVDLAVTVTPDFEGILLPRAAIGTGIGLLPGGRVTLRTVGLDAAGHELLGGVPVYWLSGEVRARTAETVRWQEGHEEETIRTLAGGAVTVVHLSEAAAASLALADLARGTLPAALELPVGGTLAVAVVARDSEGRLLQGGNEPVWARVSAGGDRARLWSGPTTAVPVLELSGLAEGPAELSVTAHGRTATFAVVVVAADQ